MIINKFHVELDKLHNGHSALHACSHNGQMHILKILLQANANVEIGVKILIY